jgi:hypothetical protein
VDRGLHRHARQYNTARRELCTGREKRTMRTMRMAGRCLLLMCISVAAQKKVLTNQDVIAMVKAGFDDSTIVLALQANPHDFDLSVPGVIALKKANVSDTVLLAMIRTSRSGGAPGASPAPDTSVAPAANAPTTPWRGPAVFQPFPMDFSAESFATIGAQAPVLEAKVFAGNGRLRFERTGTIAKITIIDPLKPEAYVQSPGKTPEVTSVFQGVRGSPAMMPGISMYLLPADPQNPCQNWTAVECKAMGTETVDGRATTKWDLAHHFEDVTWHSTVWVDVRLHVVSKRQYEENVFQMRNIVEGPQPANLFQMQ